MRGNRLLKNLDFFIGVPLIYLLSVIPKKRKQIKSSRVGILMTAAIGDTLLAASVLKEARELRPDMRFVLICPPSISGVADLIGAFDEKIHISVNNPLRSIRTIRKHEFDMWFDCGQWPRLNAILSFFSRSNKKIGFKTKGQGRHYAYDYPIKHLPSVHEIENYRNLFRRLRKDLVKTPEIIVGERKDRDFIIFHICPSGEKSYLKEWPKDHWVKLGYYFINKGYSIYLSGSAEDKIKNDSVLKQLPKGKVRNLAGETSLGEVCNYLSSARLVISVNTGIMHLASAVNANLVALNGPTSSKRWGPLNQSAVSLQAPLRCSPCLNLGFEYGCNKNSCMQSISAERVIKEVELNFNLSKN